MLGPGEMEESRTINPRPLDAPIRHPLVAVLVAVVAGICLDRYLGIPVIWSILFAIGVATGSQIVCLEWTRFSRVGHKRLATVLVLLGLMAASAAWHHMRWRYFADNDIGLWAGAHRRPVALQCRATEFPRFLQATDGPGWRAPGEELETRLNVKVVAVRDGADWKSASGFVTMMIKGTPEGIGPGDLMEAFAFVQSPSGNINPGGFSYSDYLRSRRQLARLVVHRPESVRVIAAGNRWNPRWLVAHLRRFGRSQLTSYLPASQADLASALLLGDRDYLDDGRTDAFMQTGTVHLLAISGLHVTIVAFMFYMATRLAVLPERASLIAVMGVTILYMCLSGCRAPVVRATILVLVICLGRLLRRDSLGFNSLALAGLIVLAWNPCQLFQTGAQLSFLAVAAMMWYLPCLTQRRPMTPVERLVARRRSYFEVWFRIGCWNLYRIATASVVIWFVSLPLVMNRFHLVSPIGLVLNLFLWIPVAIALLAGFMVLLFGGLIPPVAQWAGWICTQSIDWTEHCVHAAGEIPGSHFWVAGPKTPMVLGFYLFLAICTVLPSTRRWWPVWTIASLLMVAASCFVHSTPTFSVAGRSSFGKMQCTFLAVGHGCGTVIEFPNGEVWVYDAGSLGNASRSLNVIARYLWSRGITKLDAVILSHADVDHYNAMPGLLERFDVGRVFVPPEMFSGNDENLKLLSLSLQGRGVPVIERAAGEAEIVGQWRVEVLGPRRESGTLPGDDNARSLVLRLGNGHRNMLLTGDVEQEGLDWLLSLPGFECDVALAPHHGSIRSHPERFCEWCSPDVVVVSAGPRASSTVGVAAYQAAGCRVLQTSLEGAIQIRVGDSNEVDVRPFRVASNVDHATTDLTQAE